MNQYFYESRIKEKIKDILDEGVSSQALHRSKRMKSGALNHLPKFILLLGALSLLGYLVH